MPKARLKRMRRRKFIRRLTALSLIVSVIIALAVMFLDAGSNMILGLAENYVSENMNLILRTESVKGNPIKGYTFRGMNIEDENGKSILSAEYLSGHISFSSLMKGRMRLSEILIQNISLDIEDFVSTVYDARQYRAYHEDIFESPAFASDLTSDSDSDSNSDMRNVKYIPFDKLTLRGGKFQSRFGTVNIKTINADMTKFKAEVDADINDIALKGNIDMGEVTNFASINRADMTFGSGKITAVGGLFNDDIFDFHATAEDLNLKEITALFNGKLIPDNFDGTMNLNFDVTGVKESPKMFGSIDYRGTKIFGLPVERMSANYNYSPDERILTVNNIQASSLNIPVQGEMSAMRTASDDVIVRIRLDGSEANLEGLDEVLNMPELKSLKGRTDSFNVNISGNINSLNGLVNLSAPKIMYSGRTFSGIKIQIKLAQSSTASVDGKFSFEDANGFIQGSIQSVLREANMNLTAKIADLDIKRVANMIPDSPSYNLAGKITASLNIKGSMSKPVITGSINSDELSGWSQKIMKPVIYFSFTDRALNIEKAEGTVNKIPVAVTGTIKPVPSSNPELDITAGLNTKLKTGIRITGTLNNPSFSLSNASEDTKPASPDIKTESHDTEIISTDTNHTVSIEIESMKESISEDTKANIKEAASKDENAVK